MSDESRIVATPPRYAFQVFDPSSGKSVLVVAVRYDGGVEYGPAYTTDSDAARRFWKALDNEWFALRSVALPQLDRQDILDAYAYGNIRAGINSPDPYADVAGYLNIRLQAKRGTA